LILCNVGTALCTRRTDKTEDSISVTSSRSRWWN